MDTSAAPKNVRTLLTRGLQRPSSSDDTWNPLREDDQLQEAVLIEVLFDVTTSTVGVLLDLNNALQLREGAVGLLVVREAFGARWLAENRGDTYYVWTVGSSVPSMTDGGFRMDMGMAVDGSLIVMGQRAEFYEFDVNGGEVVDDPARDVVGQNPEWVRPAWSQTYEMRNYWIRSAVTTNGVDDVADH